MPYPKGVPITEAAKAKAKATRRANAKTCRVCDGTTPCGRGWFYCNGHCCDIYCVTAALDGPEAVAEMREIKAEARAAAKGSSGQR